MESMGGGGLGTSTTTDSHVWLTLQGGILTEVYWGRPGEPAVSRKSEERAIAVGQKRDKCRIHRASSRSTCASDSGVFFTASATRARRGKFRETRSASIDEMSFSSSHGVTLSLRTQKRKESGLFRTVLPISCVAGRTTSSQST